MADSTRHYYGTPDQAASLLASTADNVTRMPPDVRADPAVAKAARRLITELCTAFRPKGDPDDLA